MKITITIEIDEQELQEQNENESKKDSPKDIPSIYARLFDAGCTGWMDDSRYNLMYLQTIQHNANARLRVVGHLFLNDVYEMLGIPKTKSGQIVGWIYEEENPIGDNYVDFGLENERAINFVNGLENVVLLDFNVDGNILDRL